MLRRMAVALVFSGATLAMAACGSSGDDGGGGSGTGGGSASGGGGAGGGSGGTAATAGTSGGGSGGNGGTSNGGSGGTSTGGSGGTSSGGAAGASGGAAGASGGAAGASGGAAGSSGSGGIGPGGTGGAGGTAASGGTGGGTGGTGGTPGCFEGAIQECYSADPLTKGVGACTAGSEECVNGAWTACTGEVVPIGELCNLVDDDCDGQVDELGQLTCGQGACKVTVEACDNGVGKTCVPGTPSASEQCDGVDDDCDGTIDEGCSCTDGQKQSCYTGPLGTQGKGICKSGEQTCVNGAWGVCVGDVVPGTETCNGTDDDCDNETDENLGVKVCGLGACQKSVPACANGQVGVCTPGTPSTETCNGIDDDCDGTPDDGLPTSTCGTGACQVTAPTCLNGQANTCVPGTPGTEFCNGVDDDCDGTADDGLGSLTCGTGACQKTVPACLNGWPNQCFPGQPTTESCNGKDDDCDGQTDEGNPGGGASCSTGLQGVCGVGATVCTNGALACPQSVFPSTEICDGKDNDCDGQTDEGNPGGGASCNTGLPGVCAPGTLACTGGSVKCVQNQNATTETCNGIDDDCNGQVDQGNPGGGASCNTGIPGACAAGMMLCLGGSLSCSQLIYPETEVCANSKDDDCDGSMDESEDKDGDGFGHCTGDCCDAVGPCSGTPQLVNPGAYEVIGNGVDDDCDPSTSDTVPTTACSTAAKFSSVLPDDVAKAIDLCQFTTLNPPPAQKKWGVITAEFRLANGAVPNATQLSNMQNWQAAVLTNYGTGGIVPKMGPTFAGISAGRMRDQNDTGYVNPNSGTNLGSSSTPPAAYLAAHGGSLPASAGCSGNCPAGSGANDSINVRLTIRVPTNAQSFSYEFRFFSAEYWTWQCTAYNDFYLALLQTGAAGIPADKNISFDALNNPVSVNNGFFDLCTPKGCNTCPAGMGELNGTGMQVSNTGGGTKWLVTTAPLVSGEVMQIEFMVFDVSDNILDSLTILDNFKWSLSPATVGTTPAG